MPRVVIVRNPVARRAISAARLEAACASLGPEWDVEVRDSISAGGVADLARDAAASGADYVLACGGDGTLGEVVNGVLAVDAPDVVVGLIPAGTANVWAREAGIPLGPGAVRLLEDGQDVRLDLGRVRADGRVRHFVLMCSMGIDAAVVEEVERRPILKRRLRQAAFVVAGVPAFVRGRPVPVTTSWAGSHDDPLVILVAGNSRLYGGVIGLTSAARMDDGLLDLAVFRARRGVRGLIDVAVHLGRGIARLRRPWHDLDVARFEYRREASCFLTPRMPLAVQCDGEFFGWVPAGKPVVLEAAPRAVRMLVPRQASPLFSLG